MKLQPSVNPAVSCEVVLFYSINETLFVEHTLLLIKHIILFAIDSRG